MSTGIQTEPRHRTGPDSSPSVSERKVLRHSIALTRGVWTIAALLGVTLVASVPAEFSRLVQNCSAASSGCSEPHLTPQIVHDLHQLGLPATAFAVYFLVVELLQTSIFISVAAVLFWRKRGEWVALLAAVFLLNFGLSLGTLDALTSTRSIWLLPALAVRFLGTASFFLFGYIFPDGRFVPRWMRWPALLVAAWQVPDTFFPSSPLSTYSLPRSLRALTWLLVVGSILFVQVYRYRRISSPAERQQTKWVVFGIALTVSGVVALIGCTIMLGGLLHGLSSTLLGSTVYYLIFLPIPVSIGMAVLRFRLWDIDLVINRALVYSGLTACVSALYVLIVGVPGALLQARGNVLLSLLAAGLVAILFQPLRERLQRRVNRLMYGERDDPYTVISRLGNRLEETLTPGAVLSTIVETVAEAMRLPYVAITLARDGDVVLATSLGSLPPVVARFSLRYGAEEVGELVLAPRSPGEAFSPPDLRLLQDLARQAGIAAHAVRLTADLQHSRERLVSAREEERRRLRRDLHDGLGPALASQTLALEGARTLLKTDPVAADALLADLAHHTKTAVADIRRIVYDLRPPALDQLGLVAALQEQLARYAQAELTTVLDISEPLPPLPAAVEVAAYRIAQEALTNVIRHGGATQCSVRVWLDDGNLVLEVRDNGRGIPADRRAGVGITSMRERAEELGGDCRVLSPPDGGALVIAQLPIAGEE